MYPQSLLFLLISLPFSLAGNTAPTLDITNIVFSSYYTFRSPSATGPKAGYIDFDVTNSAVNDSITCSGVNSNPWAVFYESDVYDCVITESGDGHDESMCWTDSASFSLDTAELGVTNLTFDMSWTCEGVGIYMITAWTLLDLDCEKWTCTNNLWTDDETAIYSNSTTVCQPGSFSFPSKEMNIQKLG
ncbi:hypothetical protein DDE82_001842 [Stemphylium lycopersici]|uniref:AA1-like domain-containing protein n=1 Tax=Stemphylium lycopersici TaxID=183478 RepID=A0A364N9R8_STELY|nr:hypothetical protein DDE82_001842 [Stemphylium lycopersici]RAR14022.1 hypothetical protein DDE83_002591 [Stemphylium lycopersici]